MRGVSKRRYVFVGVIFWGLPTAILWAITMYGFEGVTVGRLAHAVPIFGAAGAIFGWVTWRLSGLGAPPPSTPADDIPSVSGADFKVRSTILLVMGVLFLPLAIPSTIAVFPDRPALSIAMVPLIGLAVYCSAVLGGTIHATAEWIELRCLAGVFRIRWDELTTIERDAEGSLTFCAAERHLPIPAPRFWSGGDKVALTNFVAAQIHARNIPTRANAWSGWRIPWGVRVRR